MITNLETLMKKTHLDTPIHIIQISIKEEVFK